jgi:hypothetical protein
MTMRGSSRRSNSNKFNRIFAHNGSLLAHAHRDERPIRLARTESATFSSAYLSYMNDQRSRTHNRPTSDDAGEATTELTDPESIVYESHTSNHITVITPIAPKVLLAVTGTITKTANPPAQDDGHSEDAPGDASTPSTTSPPASSPSLPAQTSPNGVLESPKSLLEELGSVSERLSSVLREEMGNMRWPDGA